MQSTRERILNILKESGQATVDDLSQGLGLTAVTVRHHLDILRGEGLINSPIIRRRKTPGRPQYVYTLAEKASAFFPKRYDHLARLILEEVRACLPPAKVSELLQRVGERIASQAVLPDSGDLEVRVSAAVDYLDHLGYMARWERHDDGFLIHIINCPYERVAQRDEEICTVDLVLLRCLLGVTPQPISRIPEGYRQCTYAIHAP